MTPVLTSFGIGWNALLGLLTSAVIISEIREHTHTLKSDLRGFLVLLIVILIEFVAFAFVYQMTLEQKVKVLLGDFIIIFICIVVGLVFAIYDRIEPAMIPGGNVPQAQPAAIPGGNVPQAQPAAIPGGNVPQVQPAASPSGNVPQAQPVAMPGGNVPQAQPATVPGGNVRLPTSKVLLIGGIFFVLLYEIQKIEFEILPLLFG